MPSFQRIPTNVNINLILPETRVSKPYHSLGLFAYDLRNYVRKPQSRRYRHTSANTEFNVKLSFRVIRGETFWCLWKVDEGLHAAIILLAIISLKVPKTYRPKTLKNAVFDHSSVVWRPSPGNPYKFPHKPLYCQSPIVYGWRCWFNFIEVFVMSFKRTHEFRNRVRTGRSGLSKSIFLAPIESAYATSY